MLVAFSYFVESYYFFSDVGMALAGRNDVDKHIKLVHKVVKHSGGDERKGK